MKELNTVNKTKYFIDSSLQDRNLRNCIAHYGLGQILGEQEIIDNDVMKGLTQKVFGMDYYTCKKKLYNCLGDLANQIKENIF